MDPSSSKVAKNSSALGGDDHDTTKRNDIDNIN